MAAPIEHEFEYRFTEYEYEFVESNTGDQREHHGSNTSIPQLVAQGVKL